MRTSTMAFAESHPIARLLAQAVRDVNEGVERHDISQVEQANAAIRLARQLIEVQDQLMILSLRQAIEAISDLTGEMRRSPPPGDTESLRRRRNSAVAAIVPLYRTLYEAQPSPQAKTLGLDW